MAKHRASLSVRLGLVLALGLRLGLGLGYVKYSSIKKGKNGVRGSVQQIVTAQ